MSRVYGIDLGTSTLKIFQKGTGMIYNQRNVIAVFDKKKIIATGDEAWAMDGRAPSNIEVIHPVRAGVLAELRKMIDMLNIIFENLGEIHGKMTGQEFLVAIPAYATEVEKKALVDLIAATEVKPKRIRVVDRPIADALGVGINIKECFGTMIVDIGADTTEISVVSLGGIVVSRMLNFGGNRLDESIISAVRKEYNFLIGKKTAEQVKNSLGSAIEPGEGEEITKKAFGRDIVSGLPGSITVDSVFVYYAMKEHIQIIAETVRNILEHCAPEISVDIMESGLYLTGGVSGIKGFDRLLSDMTGLKVTKCPKGSESVALGLGRVAEENELDFLAEKYSMMQIMN